MVQYGNAHSGNVTSILTTSISRTMIIYNIEASVPIFLLLPLLLLLQMPLTFPPSMLICHCFKQFYYQYPVRQCSNAMQLHIVEYVWTLCGNVWNILHIVLYLHKLVSHVLISRGASLSLGWEFFILINERGFLFKSSLFLQIRHILLLLLVTSIAIANHLS